VKRFKALINERTGKSFPQDAKKQLWGAIGAVFGSWMNDRAIVYRRKYGIPHSWGTAVNVQTMVFGMTSAEQAVAALGTLPPKHSDAWYLALMARQFPGSWLPFGQEQVIRCAEANFALVSSTSGRLDYIETISQWNARIGARSLRKSLLKLTLVPRWLSNADFRLAFASGVSANKVCFERGLLDHYRMVFERQG